VRRSIKQFRMKTTSKEAPVGEAVVVIEVVEGWEAVSEVVEVVEGWKAVSEVVEVGKGWEAVSEVVEVGEGWESVSEVVEVGEGWEAVHHWGEGRHEVPWRDGGDGVWDARKVRVVAAGVVPVLARRAVPTD